MTKNEDRKPFQKHIPDEAQDHFRNARSEIKKGIEALFPPELHEHRQEARKEMLLAFRSMIDAAIEQVEGDQE